MSAAVKPFTSYTATTFAPQFSQFLLINDIGLTPVGMPLIEDLENSIGITPIEVPLDEDAEVFDLTVQRTIEWSTKEWKGPHAPTILRLDALDRDLSMPDEFSKMTIEVFSKPGARSLSFLWKAYHALQEVIDEAAELAQGLSPDQVRTQTEMSLAHSLSQISQVGLTEKLREALTRKDRDELLSVAVYLSTFGISDNVARLLRGAVELTPNKTNIDGCERALLQELADAANARVGNKTKPQAPQAWLNTLPGIKNRCRERGLEEQGTAYLARMFAGLVTSITAQDHDCTLQLLKRAQDVFNANGLNCADEYYLRMGWVLSEIAAQLHKERRPLNAAEHFMSAGKAIKLGALVLIRRDEAAHTTAHRFAKTAEHIATTLMEKHKKSASKG